ncbi:biorientation of chromosomes in cell division protein 1-like 1 isoform X1 [Octopus bimaculoides]|uniref:BOD1/SHG1 domain-containing protein n=1 Tax=Octopus bimaculoides TaxID=37653 RepID=A0A0L8HJ60_OCTBM|nr:biorientation of chromosomes in cell division protein 1-like 1 isoform X1 [Octopus bimaculoides]|eukprot:XP_014771911.1 PREDICTED: biorientation of chromosomes in cell division protein 1-like 1 isoform X1 [Octopus bimaculoides]
MSTAVTSSSPGDPKLVQEIIDKLKSQGLFDQFRKEGMGDVDTKPAYQNLRQRMEGHVSRFLEKQVWSPNLNKNQLRDQLRKHINQSGILASGVERIIEQVVNPKIFLVIKPRIDEVICEHLEIDFKERQEKLLRKKHQQQALAAAAAAAVAASNNAMASHASYGNTYFPYQQTTYWQQQQQIRPLPPSTSQQSQPPTPLAQNQQKQTILPFSLPDTSKPPPAAFLPATGGFGLPQQPYPIIPQQTWNTSVTTTTVSTTTSFNPMYPPHILPPSVPLAAGAPLPLMNFTSVPPPTSSSKASVTSSTTSLTNSSIKETGRGLLATPNLSQAIAPITLPPMNVPPPVSPAPLQPPGIAAPALHPPVLPPLNMPPPPITDPLTRPLPSLPPHGHGPSKAPLDNVPMKVAVKTPLLPDPIITKLVNKPYNNPVLQPPVGLPVMQSSLPPNVPVPPLVSQPALPPLTKPSLPAIPPKPLLPQPAPPPCVTDILPPPTSSSSSSSSLPSLPNHEDHQSSKIPEINREDINQRISEPPESLKLAIEEKSWSAPKLEDIPLPHLPFTVATPEKNKPAEPLVKEKETKVPEQTVEISEEKSVAENSSTVKNNSKDVPSDGFVEQTSASTQPSADVEAAPEEKSRTYKFSWSKGSMEGELSDFTISSVHTSDLSSFDEGDGNISLSDVNSSPRHDSDTNPDLEDVAEKVVEKTEPSPCKETKKAKIPPRPRKLISLSYNYSDSDDDETREERKERIAKEKEERYLRRQQRRAGLEAKRKDREEEKQRLCTKTNVDSDERKEDSALPPSKVEPSITVKSEDNEKKEAVAVPRKKSKEEMKEELRSQKVMEKRLALRRRRTRNKRYTSEEFTSIFTEKGQSFSNLSYQDIDESSPDQLPGENVAQFESTENETGTSQAVEMDDCFPESPPTPTQDEHDPDIYDTPASEVLVSELTKIPIYEMGGTTAYSAALGLGPLDESVPSKQQTSSNANSKSTNPESSFSGTRCTSPYSDISESSKEDLIDEMPKEKKPILKKKEEKITKIEKPSQKIPLLDTYSSKRKPSSHGHYNLGPAARPPPLLPKLSAADNRSRSGQRYNIEDLYKPRISHRRTLSPTDSGRYPDSDRHYNAQRYSGDTSYKNRTTLSSLGSSAKRRHTTPPSSSPLENRNCIVMPMPRASSHHEKTKMRDNSFSSSHISQEEQQTVESEKKKYEAELLAAESKLQKQKSTLESMESKQRVQQALNPVKDRYHYDKRNITYPTTAAVEPRTKSPQRSFADTHYISPAAEKDVRRSVPVREIIPGRMREPFARSPLISTSPIGLHDKSPSLTSDLATSRTYYPETDSRLQSSNKRTPGRSPSPVSSLHGARSRRIRTPPHATEVDRVSQWQSPPRRHSPPRRPTLSPTSPIRRSDRYPSGHKVLLPSSSSSSQGQLPIRDLWRHRNRSPDNTDIGHRTSISSSSSSSSSSQLPMRRRAPSPTGLAGSSRNRRERSPISKRPRR